jgi:outer membrane protein, heavy metal efflux system
MLGAALGRQNTNSFPVPQEPPYRLFPLTAEETVDKAIRHSPDIKYRSKMIKSAETRHQMAKKEYFPDFAINAGYFNRSGDFKDMWSATATINIPLYFTSKQRPAVFEAKANIDQLKQELAAAKLMIAAAVKDNYAMLRTAEKLMDIYKNGLIPKNRQDMEQALTNYSAGRSDASGVISRMKTLLDYEVLYWNQLVEREKAIVRLQAITEGLDGKAGGEER